MRPHIILLVTIQIISFLIFPQNTNAQDKVELKITGSKGKKGSLLLSEIAHSIQYIALETSEDVLVGNCRIEPIGDQLLIMENQLPLRLFDSDGSFIKNIGSIGKGPGEYPEYYSCTADQTRKLIFILNDINQEVLVYNIDGDYLDKIQLQNQTFSFHHFNDDNLLTYSLVHNENGRTSFQFQYIGDGGNKVSTIINKQSKISGVPIAFSPPLIQTLNSGGIIINRLYGDTLFSISPNGEKSVFCTMDFKGELIPEEILYDMNRMFSERDKYIYNFAAFNYHDYILFSYSYHGKPHRGAFNKITKSQFLINNWEDCGTGLPNNIDGGPGFFASECIRGDKAFTVIQSSSIKEWYSSGNLGKAGYTDEKAHSKLMLLLSMLSEEDNPIIMLTHLK
ncbi:MAG: 6-bladed beta-propeller [Bacteroidetes bacterium]|jgi:hypothetical protein|nr:6-bladed beta-propeller [Bacteroidota bacterium]MBT4402032.1 6-bladed beta-propeller [Bacteroidota bacterium]MBT4411735.1 6-bladed beta-propeller [Bacteroidota bacterium]MBT7462802.1 6-bladed beta-propeller [Bacteroidota bacterium]